MNIDEVTWTNSHVRYWVAGTNDTDEATAFAEDHTGQTHDQAEACGSDDWPMVVVTFEREYE